MRVLFSRKRAAVVSTVVLSAAALGTVVAAITAPAAQIGAAAAPTTVRAAAQASGRYFGTATDTPELSDAPYLAGLTGGEFGMLTPGNAMKWQFTEPSPGTFDFAAADTNVRTARQAGMRVRGHTLVWHSQLPGWVSALPSGQVRAAMLQHVTTEATHFKGQVYAWDVVNEPFNENGTFRSSPFFVAMGSSYIADALRAARAADPAAKLYINDYNVEGINAKSDALYALAKSLKASGVPLDGIGVQAHLSTKYGVPSGMQKNLQRFADLGLDVAVTELDVRIPLPADATKLATQVSMYRSVVSACVAVARCVGITVWDWTDRYSWIPVFVPGEDLALPWDRDLKPKPAVYSALLTAFAAAAPIATTAPTTTAPTTKAPTPTPTPTVAPTKTASATATAAPSTTAVAGCTARYLTTATWQGGYTGQVTVTAAGRAINRWTVTMTLPTGSAVTQLWNGTATATGRTVSVAALDWNGRLAAGGTADFGFVGAGAAGVTTLTCTAG